MNKMTKTLFGGALLTAGMSMASAQSFTQPGNIPPYADDFQSGYVYNYYSVGFEGGQTVNGGFGSSYSFSNAYGSGSGSLTSTSLLADANAYGNPDLFGFAIGDSYGYLSVTEDATLNVAWDFTAGTGFSPVGSEITVVDWSAGGILVFQAIGGSAGSDAVALSAGANYGILVRAVAGQDQSAFGSAVLVPAPGAMGLLGAAGLVAARRRR